MILSCFPPQSPSVKSFVLIGDSRSLGNELERRGLSGLHNSEVSTRLKSMNDRSRGTSDRFDSSLTISFTPRQ